MERIYRPLPEFSNDEIKAILKSDNIYDLAILPLSVGEYHIDWKFAQDICVKISTHKDQKVSSNAALGLAYIARTKGKLEKHIVKPILLKLLIECTNEGDNMCRGKVIDAIGDINLYMDWHIAEKAASRAERELEEMLKKQVEI